MYKPPVTIEYENYPKTELKNNGDEMILKAIAEVGINVDKDELLKAMNYDRGQYEKGFEDGREYERKHRNEINNG